MAARRCSTCSINWPLHARECGKCNGPLWHIKDGEADSVGDVEAVDEAEAIVSALDDPTVKWRRQELLRMGLDTARSEIGAATRCEPPAQGFRVDLHRFSALRERGATAAQAFEILF